MSEETMMFERDGYPAGVPCWVDLSQPDPEAAVTFYGGLFGWEFEDLLPSGGSDHYYLARLHGRDVAAVGSLAEGVPPSVWTTYVAVDSADAAAAAVRRAGGQVRGPVDVPGAGRMVLVTDPSGAQFCLWEARGRVGAQLVNEPGTWNWSNLHTPDLQRARDFYGAVFGWEAVGADLGADVASADFAMWQLPGYGKYLETIDPDLRRRHADASVPEGFSDTVAWLVRTTSEAADPRGTQGSVAGGDGAGPAADAASQWEVTFVVADTDATVERAAALGATVITPPFDSPPVRSAVLADPQGATFTVNTYQPDA